MSSVTLFARTRCCDTKEVADFEHNPPLHNWLTRNCNERRGKPGRLRVTVYHLSELTGLCKTLLDDWDPETVQSRLPGGNPNDENTYISMVNDIVTKLSPVIQANTPRTKYSVNLT